GPRRRGRARSVREGSRRPAAGGQGRRGGGDDAAGDCALPRGGGGALRRGEARHNPGPGRRVRRVAPAGPLRPRRGVPAGGAGRTGAVQPPRRGDRRIEAGEPIWIDIGAIVDGYRSDITRTVCLGKPDDRYVRIWNEVRETQRRVLDFIRPGREGLAVDKLA